nr:DMT family transporter [Candidatus Eremiobacteraeota bacterium]
AVHSVLMKRVVVEIEPLAITVVQQTVGALVVGTAVLFSRQGANILLELGIRELALISVAGVFTMALPFVLYITAVRKISGASAGIAIAFIPVSGLTLSSLILRDGLSPLQVAGAVLTVVALLFAARVEARFAYIPR